MQDFVTDIWTAIATHIEADSDSTLYFVSPYLTGPRLFNFLEAHRDRKVLIIIDLNPQAVASGSLSIRELRRLAERFQLIHVPNLHAKIVTDGNVAIVGSQNLTVGGEIKNLEASVITDEKPIIDQIQFFMNQLLQHSTSVTDEMLDNLTSILPEIEEATKIIETVSNRFEASIEDHTLLKVLENARQLFLADAPQNSYPLRCVSVEYETDYQYNYYWTLKRKNSGDSINAFESMGEIAHQNHVFAFDARTLQPFWVPANKSQIGKFITSMSSSSRGTMGFLSEFDFQRWEISLVNPLEQADYSNIHLRLFFAPYDMHRVSIHINYLFDGDMLYRANEMFKDVTPEETLVLDKTKESLFLEWKKAIGSIDEKIDEELGLQTTSITICGYFLCSH